MMENSHLETTSYVLFGDEAIKIYTMSLKLLLSSKHVNYKVATFKEVKPFMAEAVHWDNYLEITKDEYLQLKQNKLHNDYPVKPKRNGFFNFFK